MADYRNLEVLERDPSGQAARRVQEVDAAIKQFQTALEPQKTGVSKLLHGSLLKTLADTPDIWQQPSSMFQAAMLESPGVKQYREELETKQTTVGTQVSPKLADDLPETPEVDDESAEDLIRKANQAVADAHASTPQEEISYDI